MNFKTWINALIDEKGIDRETVLEADGPSGTNYIPVGCLVDAMIAAPKSEQAGIRHTLVRIDFVAPGQRPVLDYFRHLARAIAV